MQRVGIYKKEDIYRERTTESSRKRKRVRDTTENIEGEQQRAIERDI